MSLMLSLLQFFANSPGSPFYIRYCQATDCNLFEGATLQGTR
jgi:hypothetical protein